MTMTLQDLRNCDEYPGLHYEDSGHLSNVNHKRIIHRDYHRSYSVSTYILLFFIFSFIGWVWEVGIHVIEDGVFVNRGTMVGPWLPIYGAGGTIGIILLKKMIDNQVLTFLMVVVLCSVVEYVSSWYLETFKHMKYWDYTGYFCNLNGRICLEGALIFGFAGCAGIYIMAPFFDEKLKKIPEKTRVTICVCLLSLFSADGAYSKFHPNEGKGITDYIDVPFKAEDIILSAERSDNISVKINE